MVDNVIASVVFAVAAVATWRVQKAQGISTTICAAVKTIHQKASRQRDPNCRYCPSGALCVLDAKVGFSRTKVKNFEMKNVCYFINVKLKKEKKGATGIPIAEIPFRYFEPPTTFGFLGKLV